MEELQGRREEVWRCRGGPESVTSVILERKGPSPPLWSENDRWGKTRQSRILLDLV